MNKLLLISTLCISLSAASQDNTVKQLQKAASRDIKKDPNDTIPRTWKTGGLYNINLSQGSLSNWAAGGDNFSLSVNSVLSLFAYYQKEKNSWDNTLDFNLGYVKTTSLGDRKNDDRLDFLSKYGYAIGPKLNLSALFNFRTQLFNGFTYDDNIPKRSSTFLAPAYVILSPGLDWKPNKDLSVFVSPATFRWVIVNDAQLSAAGAYGVAPGKKSLSEVGAFLTANYLKEISKSVTYKGRLDLFSNYKKNPQNVDLFMSNMWSFKISKILSATYSLDLIYDDDAKLFGPNGTSPALQVKSLIGIGLLFKF